MFEFSKVFEIDGRAVGDGQPVYVIAEAGISHFGNEEKAYQLVDMAVEAQADAVKFQVFDIDQMIASEQTDWRERLGPRQLPYQAFERIQRYCNEQGITFFATAHDDVSLNFLHSIDIPVYKIGSGELGNWPYFQKIATFGKPVIFSTGMYDMDDIESAADVFRKCDLNKVAILHCVTSYPTMPLDVRLQKIAMLRERFGAITGYSDHTSGMHIPYAAVALGAQIIEKHITLEYDIPNAQDWKVSCGPENLRQFVSEIRDIEQAIAGKNSGPTDSEKESKIWATKSLVFKREMKCGQIITESNLIAKRPGSGISPADIDTVIGRKLLVDVSEDEILKWEYIR